MTFDDSYILYVNQIDFFKSGFGLVFTNKTPFCEKIRLWDLYIKRKNDVQTIFDDPYILYANQIDIF